ncbi:hypothetical protein [Enterococcus plantarum]|uniref:hypothetical protein n=1 Tax=Enterococcus plantarum TaxID=1077675 RepID=UPI001A8DA9EF|nr:hypothetical protein [Enterococcus plantarum]MBO0423872.1 hypothetical protein [Enterococcus plantarum]
MAKIDFKKKVEQYENKVTNIVLRKAEEPIFITFNFSFLTDNSSYNLHCDSCTHDHRHHLIERLLNLSNKDLVSLTAKTNKNWGLEKLKKDDFGRNDKIKNLKISSKFESSKRSDLAGDGYWIFRLCPNNNPFESRIIGKMIDDIFYVMFIDYNHELYAKRK